MVPTGNELPELCVLVRSTWPHGSRAIGADQIATALQELRRVLKPGGTFHFVEHGLAPDDDVQRWQHRVEPFNKKVAGGCHLTRPIADLITDAGFEITELDRFYEKGAPKFAAAFSLGVAISP